MTDNWDVIIVGAGSAGIPAAIFAGQRGARVLLVEADNRIGGTLHWSTGQLSAAGTKLQKRLGIDDHPDWHYEDCQRVMKNTVDPVLGRFAIDNAADTLDWLMDNGFELAPETPVAQWGHEPYRVRRYQWGPNGALSVLEVMQPLLDKEIGRGTVTLSLQTKLTGLVVEEGVVVGVDVEARDGTTATIHGQNVVLTTGGYAANPELWAELTPDYPLRSYCNPYSRGEGIVAARAIGAKVDRGDMFMCTFAGVLQDPDDPLSVRGGLTLNPRFRIPWEIYVNRSGKRFVREDHPSDHHREHALLEQDGMETFIVFDEGIRQNAPHFDPEVEREHVAKLFGNHPSYFQADTLAELAAQCGIDAANLEASVAEYNEAVETGTDPAFGREALQRSIDTPPYLAIRAVGMTVVSPAGINADGGLQVFTADGSPIPNLYAAGEVLGFARLSGAGYLGGMSLTPALTFGRLLGQRILTWEGAREAAQQT
jgi:fumarate reductase flavoprotein subunit